jgi:hypothetical protein
MLGFLLAHSQEHCQKKTLHRETNLTLDSFPSITSTIMLPRNTLHHEGNLAPANFCRGKSTSSLPKTIVHHEGNLTHASFHSIMKEI